MPIVCLGLNHRTASVDVREQFALPDGKVTEMLGSLCEKTEATEAVILATCNRVEIYAATDGESVELLDGLRRFMLNGRELSPEVLYDKSGVESVEHLLR